MVSLNLVLVRLKNLNRQNKIGQRILLMKYLYFIFAIGLVNTALATNPTYDVTKGALQNDPTLCQYGYNPNCSQAHKQSQQTIEHIYVHRPPKFGALAYSSKVGHIAGSLNHNSKAEAQQAAIQRCQRGSKNTPCKVIMGTEWLCCISSRKN